MAIDGSLMRNEYVETMNEVLVALGKRPLICFTLDSATNLQGKQVINMMACVPKAYFLEHFSMELRRERAQQIFLRNCWIVCCGCCPPYKSRLRVELSQKGMHLLTIAHNEGNDIVDFGIVAATGATNNNQRTLPPAPCSRNEHFINPPMFTLCSDSPSVMSKLHRDWYLERNEFMLAYGCAPDAIHNVGMDLVKHFAGVKLALKEAVAVYGQPLHLEVQDNVWAHPFHKSRWGTIYYTAQHATAVIAACASLPGEILNSDLDINMSEDLKHLVTDPVHWKRMASMEVLFKTMTSCLTYLEGDKATFSAVYASFIAIKFHLIKLDVVSRREGLSLTEANVTCMMTLTHHHLSTIYAEAHALAFATDPLFKDI